MVSTAGEVTAVAEGTATITVTTTDGAKTASCVVTGVGRPADNIVFKAWGGNEWSWGNDAMVYPVALVGNPTTWPQSTAGTAHKWFFSGNEVTTGEINATDIANGVGDPCTYYLGGTWRLPTNAEYGALAPDAANKGPWVSAPAFGRWFGVNPGTASSSIFFSASGNRSHGTGSFDIVSTSGTYASSSILNNLASYYLLFNSDRVTQNSFNRTLGLPVRCVRPV